MYKYIQTKHSENGKKLQIIFAHPTSVVFFQILLDYFREQRINLALNPKTQKQNKHPHFDETFKCNSLHNKLQNIRDCWKQEKYLYKAAYFVRYALKKSYLHTLHSHTNIHRYNVHAYLSVCNE